MPKIPEFAVSVPARLTSFGGEFATTRMSEDQLENAAKLPESDPSVLEVPWQSEAVILAQAPHVIAAERGLANLRSLGQGTLDAIGTLVSQKTFDHDTDVMPFLQDAVNWVSTVDDMAEGLGSVPFVGMALGVIVGVAKILRRSLRSQAPLPPRLEMDPVLDQGEVNRALRLIRTSRDWTPLFLPKPGPVNAEFGGWTTTPEKEGFLFSRGTGIEFGCAPGDLFFVAKGVQARVSTADVTIPNSSRRPPRSLILRTGDNPTTLRERVVSIGEWYPGLAALGRSVWSMIGTDSPAMFQVDGFALVEGWSDYHESTARFRSEMDRWLGRKLRNRRKRWKRERIAEYIAHVGAAFHDVRYANGEPLSEKALLELAMNANARPVAQTVGLQAARAGANLVSRQYAAAKSPLNALVSKNAPALRANRELREFFLQERAEQRRAGKFDNIDLTEVPDERLKSKLLARRRTRPGDGAKPVRVGGGATLADPATLEKRRRERAGLKIPKPPKMTGFGVPAESKPTSRGGFILGATLVAAAGLGGAAVVAHRRKTSRSRRTAGERS